VSPHFDRHAAGSNVTTLRNEIGGAPEDDAMTVAAEALREAELEAVQPDFSSSESTALEQMSIDDLRKLAAKLDVPNRGAITQQDELIAAIRTRL
jgi:hypothetical protein